MNAFAVSSGGGGGILSRGNDSSRGSSATLDKNPGGLKEESVSCKCLNLRFSLSSFVENESREETLTTPGQSESLLSEFQSSPYYDYDATITSLLDSPRLVKSEITSQHSHHGISAAAFMHFKETKHAGQWSLFRCFNCDTLTHMVSLDKPDIVLVNVGEMLDQSQQEAVMKNNPNYCNLFGVVCTPVDTRRTTPMKSSLKPSIMNLVRDIKDNADDYLRDEKSKMNERVREYEKAEMAAYLDLERSVLASQQNLEKQLRAVYSDFSTDDEDSAFERSIEEISIGNLENKERSSTAVDEMFELDPLAYDDDDNTAVNDDIFDDDDDLNATPNYKNRDSSSGMVDMAKSVPIPIMRRMRGSTSAISPSPDSSERGEAIPDPKDMEASINALARSVGFDGTEIFGELPRPRFNTGVRNPRARHY